MNSQVAIAAMTYGQALDWKERLCQSARNFRDILLEGHDGRAWEALGYQNYTQCLHSLAREFGFSPSHAWHELSAGKIERNLLDHGQVETHRISERHLRPLSKLTPDEQHEAWREAVETAPNGKITGAHVEQVVRRFKKNELPKAMVYERTELRGGIVECSRCKNLYDGSKIEYCPYCAYTREQRVQYLRHEQQKSSQQVHYSSDSPEWYTPEHIISRVVKVLGHIDLDPCSNDKDHPNVPALKYYTIEDDGLSHEWHGRVYMNPPYGKEIKGWINQLCKEWDGGRITEAIALVPARTDTVWFKWLRRFPRCFIWGRLHFSGHETGAPFPSMAVYLGHNLEKFRTAFLDIGDIYQLCQ